MKNLFLLTVLSSSVLAACGGGGSSGAPPTTREEVLNPAPALTLAPVAAVVTAPAPAPVVAVTAPTPTNSVNMAGKWVELNAGDPSAKMVILVEDSEGKKVWGIDRRDSIRDTTPSPYVFAATGSVRPFDSSGGRYFEQASVCSLKGTTCTAGIDFSGTLHTSTIGPSELFYITSMPEAPGFFTQGTFIRATQSNFYVDAVNAHLDFPYTGNWTEAPSWVSFTIHATTAVTGAIGACKFTATSTQEKGYLKLSARFDAPCSSMNRYFTATQSYEGIITHMDDAGTRLLFLIKDDAGMPVGGKFNS